MLKDFKSEIKTFFIVALVAIILAVGGILLLEEMRSGPVPTPLKSSGTIDCGGPEDIQCPVHFTCLKIDPLPGARGTCVLEEPVVDETAGWQTYRNEEFGFEFKHPHVPLTETIITEDVDDNGGPLSLWFEGQQVGQGQVQGQIVVSRRDTTLSTILDWQLPPGVTLHTAFTKIGAEHYDALELISGSSVQRAGYVLVNDGTEYQINIYAVRPEFRNVFDQILSTFRFTP